MPDYCFAIFAAILPPLPFHAAAAAIAARHAAAMRDALL